MSIHREDGPRGSYRIAYVVIPETPETGGTAPRLALLESDAVGRAHRGPGGKEDSPGRAACDSPQIKLNSARGLRIACLQALAILFTVNATVFCQVGYYNPQSSHRAALLVRGGDTFSSGEPSQ